MRIAMAQDAKRVCFGNGVIRSLTAFGHKVSNNMIKTVTEEEVKANMQDVLVKTEEVFGKPITKVTVRMQNGFILTESSICVDPANYSEEIGKEICLKKIEDKIWFLLGYVLQDKLYNFVGPAD